MAEITKMWIADKMREIMKHKSLDKIRVTEICNELALSGANELSAVLDLRYTPELVFELDHSIQYRAHINEVINSLDIKQDEDRDNGL